MEIVTGVSFGNKPYLNLNIHVTHTITTNANVEERQTR